ncbi:uncharacterized protein PRCAT00003003001 [Priceomyces carsonii]|uniref:uncharacterized protein n=1 Tax=Priceomyces carsonii TaxID=28549 RepID=UPI002ED946B4|nr:unnamed protein product [Priceomyces carsonii]
MSEDTKSIDGASYAEQILEAARRNNTELLLSIKADLNNDQEKLSKLINDTREKISQNSPLHIACQLGNWEFIDIVLDIEGVEIDPVNREGDTPLHLAVKYTTTEPEHGYFIVDNLLDAGSDPRIKDKSNLKPIDYASKDNVKLKELLESSEYAISMEEEAPEELASTEDFEDGDDDDEDEEGTPSDSD